MEVRLITREETKLFILDIHYAHRMPSISYAFGLFDGEELIGVCTYGKPASPSLCVGVCGKENSKYVWELNRLVLKYNRPNEASWFVSRTLKMLPRPMIIVSYADTAQNHEGIIYQATNFYFTGTTKPRTDMAGKDGKHSRHHLGDKTKRVYRSAKHRYIKFIGSKVEKKRFLKALNYPIINKKELKNRYMNYEKKEGLECQDCGKQDDTVTTTNCPYAADVGGNPNVIITVCEECLHERCMDI